MILCLYIVDKILLFARGGLKSKYIDNLFFYSM